MNNYKSIGLLFIIGALGVFVPYTILTMTFDYPDILRKDVGEVLTKFHEGGNSLIATWWFFAILGLPLIVAYKRLGVILESKSRSANWITTIGVIGLITQMAGLLRWTFVVPILADNYASGDESAKEIAIALFKVVHQYGGVILGEHIGQIFTIIWVVGISIILHKSSLFPKWIAWLGYISSFIYIIAQAELFATVIPTFPVFDLAGFIGSTLWLIWLVAIGVELIRTKNNLV